MRLFLDSVGYELHVQTIEGVKISAMVIITRKRKGSRKKSSSTIGPTTKRRGGGRAEPLRNQNFFEAIKKIR